MRDLTGVTCVVTGIIAGESRGTAEGKLRDSGAVVHSSVGQSTQLLVTGMKVGQRKIEAAQRHGATVVTWDELWRNGGTPVTVIDDDGVHAGALTSDARGDVVQIASRKKYGPMLAKADELPTGDGWLHEVKWDGYRCIATVDGEDVPRKVSMASRSGLSEYVQTFPQIARVLEQWPNVVLDGELVNLDSQSAGMTTTRRQGASYVVFDVLEMFGSDLRAMPFVDRRRVLEETLELVFKNAGEGLVILSPVFEDGEALLTTVAEKQLEGVVSKPKTSRYVDGHRGWVKVKLRNQQEFVVLGWVPGKGALSGTVGGLVLGVRDGGRWMYVGRAGTGLVDAERQDYDRRFAELAVDELDVDRGKSRPATFKDVHWLRPEMVVEVAFQRWSPDGRLVIPSLKGFRTDKSPLEVTRQP